MSVRVGAQHQRWQTHLAVLSVLPIEACPSRQFQQLGCSEIIYVIFQAFGREIACHSVAQ